MKENAPKDLSIIKKITTFAAKIVELIKNYNLKL